MVSTALVQLLCPSYGAGGADYTIFHGVLGVILALRISLSSIVATTGSGEVDSTT